PKFRTARYDYIRLSSNRSRSIWLAAKRRNSMMNINKAGTYRLGDRDVKRMGYGAMQLAGQGVFGPPKDRDQAIAVLREAVASGVDHVDTSDYYGPHIVNQIIREALSPYPEELALVTKLGARRGHDGSWLPWNDPK